MFSTSYDECIFKLISLIFIVDGISVLKSSLTAKPLRAAPQSSNPVLIKTELDDDIGALSPKI